jgi:hypothetical protein
MRYFANPLSLQRLSLEARIVYTGFCLFLLAGYASSAWLYLDDELGVSSASAERYYLGDARDSATPSDSSADGPKIDIPRDEVSSGLRFAKPPRQVMETFHFHMMTVPVVLLIVAHLFMMCSMSTRVKAWIIALATAFTFVHILLPPLIRFVTPRFAILMFWSAGVSAGLWIIMTVLPVYEMWRNGSPASAPPG